MNNQKPEPRLIGDGIALDFHSMFFTIQGEGPFAGHRSVFVRLAGCNLQCPGCDTEYTEGRSLEDTDTLVDEVGRVARAHNAFPTLVVITGGEPFRQNIGRLVQLLNEDGHTVQIESNGVFAPPHELEAYTAPEVTLVVSPKTRRINDKAARRADCFKYVLDADSVDPVDGLPVRALDHPAAGGVARPPHGKPVYLNPYDAKNDVRNAQNLRAAANSCMAHGYILGVQLHKLIGLE